MKIWYFLNCKSRNHLTILTRVKEGNLTSLILWFSSKDVGGSNKIVIAWLMTPIKTRYKIMIIIVSKFNFLVMILSTFKISMKKFANMNDGVLKPLMYYIKESKHFLIILHLNTNSYTFKVFKQLFSWSTKQQWYMNERVNSVNIM